MILSHYVGRLQRKAELVHGNNARIRLGKRSIAGVPVKSPYFITIPCESELHTALWRNPPI